MSRGPLVSTASTAPGIVRKLFAGAIDYAGLFPPAALEVDTALRNYVSYRDSGDASLLGRFVCPAPRLNELADAIDAVRASGGGIRVSAVLGAPANLGAVAEFNARANNAAVDSIEGKAERPDAIYELASKGSGLEVFVELPLGGELELLVDAVRAVGVRAKVRTGGVTTEAFPPARAVVRFIRACLAAGVPFKATAGLHHPITGTYPLTYAPDALRGTMFGFLYVFLATAFLSGGMPDDEAARLLDDRDAAAFSFRDHGADWRGHHVDSAQLAATHARVFGSWGSCSFREPLDELRSLALLS